MGQVGVAQPCRMGERAPYHHDIAALAPDLSDALPAPVARWLHLPDGTRLRASFWAPPDAPKGGILLFTGRTEYAEKYGQICALLQQAGYGVASVDWRGQGLSDRLAANPMIGHVERFAHYQRDVAALLAFADHMALSRPRHLLAHSMGGAIGLRALWQGLDVASAAFTAPMWGIAMAPALRPAAAGLTNLSQRAGFSQLLAPTQVSFSYVAIAPFEHNLLTSDRTQFERLRAQIKARPELGLGGVSMGWLSESLRENRRASSTPSPDLPCATFLGTEEAIVDPAAVHARMGAWPKGRLHIVPKARHELLMEGDAIRAEVMARIADLYAGSGDQG